MQLLFRGEEDEQSRNCVREVVLIGNVNIAHTVFKAMLVLVDFTGWEYLRIPAMFGTLLVY